MFGEPSDAARPVKMREFAIVIGAAAVVIAADVVVLPLFSDQSPLPLAVLLAGDFSVCIGFGLIGVYITSRIGLPLWWNPGTNSRQSQQISVAVLFLGVAVITAGTFITFYRTIWSPFVHQYFALLTLRSALGLSLRDAVLRGIFFHLFLFPLAVWISRHFISKKYSLILGGVTSAFLDGLNGDFFSIPPFLVALSLVYIYYLRGLLPAMIVRFLAGAIPFIVIFIVL